jgi:hypothetical protein
MAKSNDTHLVPIVPPTLVAGVLCPRCGSVLLTDSNIMWCTFLGRPGVTTAPACHFGIDSLVPLSTKVV